MAISTRHPDLAKHLEQLGELGPEGNSSDEDDGVKDGVKCYGVIQKQWRSAALIKLLRTISDFGDPSSSSRRGSRMRFRYQTDRVSLTRAVPGLPINFYDAEWLQRQSAWERKRLRINPVEYDLSIPEDIKKYVSLVPSVALSANGVLVLQSSGDRGSLISVRLVFLYAMFHASISNFYLIHNPCSLFSVDDFTYCARVLGASRFSVLRGMLGSRPCAYIRTSHCDPP